MIDSCTARAPLIRQPGHVGESKAKNRNLSLLRLKWFFSVCSETSSEGSWIGFSIPMVATSIGSLAHQLYH
jgi:hypothetical protein